jgi:ribosome-binding factor A
MAEGFRPKRIAAMIHRELASRLTNVVKDSEWGYISITHVEVSRDLKRATISYMPLGGGEISPELQQVMDAAGRQLRGPIGRSLRVRNSPELVFTPDTHTEEAVRMTRLLNQIGNDLKDDE